MTEHDGEVSAVRKHRRAWKRFSWIEWNVRTPRPQDTEECGDDIRLTAHVHTNRLLGPQAVEAQSGVDSFGAAKKLLVGDDNPRLGRYDGNCVRGLTGSALEQPEDIFFDPRRVAELVEVIQVIQVIEVVEVIDEGQ